MKKLTFLALCLLALAAAALHGQVIVGNYSVTYVFTAPSGTCSQNAKMQMVVGPGTLYSCQNGTWGQVGAGGSGSVTSFVAGNLSPLFTTSVATPTTTPTLSFSLTNAAANTAFGNFTGSPAASSYTATTGTGSPVAANTPTLITPVIGVATGSSLTLSTAAQPFSATNSTSGNVEEVADFFGSNVAAGAGHLAFLRFGVNTLSQNAMNLQFNFSASQSVTNSFSFQFTSGQTPLTLGANNQVSLGTTTLPAANTVLSGMPFIVGATKFTATGCTSITSTVGNGAAGKFTIGAASCTVVVTMNGATGLTAANGWSCHANDETTAAGNTGLYFNTNNATTATLTVPVTAVASDVIDFACSAF